MPARHDLDDLAPCPMPLCTYRQYGGNSGPVLALVNPAIFQTDPLPKRHQERPCQGVAKSH